MNWCWLLGHKTVYKDLIVHESATLQYPCCSRCRKVLTVLPAELEIQRFWQEAYKDLPIDFKEL